jgi:hypothetical protein
MRKKSTRGKKASSEGKTLRLSKQTLKDLTPSGQAQNAIKGGWVNRPSRACGTGTGG